MLDEDRDSVSVSKTASETRRESDSGEICDAGQASKFLANTGYQDTPCKSQTTTTMAALLPKSRNCTHTHTHTKKHTHIPQPDTNGGKI